MLVGCSGTIASRRAQREALTVELGQDPVAILSAIGTAEGQDARDMAGALGGRLTGQQHLALLRFGLGHDREAVVFGAGLLQSLDQMPVPELASAATVIAPRLGEPDCPIPPYDAQYFVGSGDFERLLPVFPQLPAEEAKTMLGALHRQMRPDAVPAMCELALTSDGEVQWAAFSNAMMSVDYGDEHVSLLVRTWLECVGGAVRDEDRVPGLPPLVRAAFRTHLERSKRPVEAAPGPGPWGYRFPSCAGCSAASPVPRTCRYWPR